MNLSNEYPRHVVLLSETYPPDIIADRVIAGIMVICFIVGIFGNILALAFFLSSEKNRLLGNLYVFISSTDLCTCAMQTPVALTLIMSRHPGVFQYIEFCAFWTVMFEFLQTSSIFLVMLMSVTRAIAIALPLWTINFKHMIWIYYGYVVLIFFECGVRHAFGVYYIFIADLSYCVKGSHNPSFSLYANITNILCIGVPSTVTFFSFILSITELRRQKIRPSKVVANRASVTIAVFTAIFLVCNVPFFGNVILFVVTRSLTSYPGPVFSSSFMFSYSWVISKVLFVVINATLNPVVYFTRMMDFKTWKPISRHRLWNRISTLKLWSSKKSIKTEEDS